MTRTLAGYTDKISACPGDTISFMVSAEDDSTEFRASLVRLHCVDSHRDGPGLQEDRIISSFDGTYRSRRQPIAIGSRGTVAGGEAIRSIKSFSVCAMIWPTLAGDGRQVIFSTLGVEGVDGFILSLDAGVRLSLHLGDGTSLRLSEPLLLREWTFVAASYY